MKHCEVCQEQYIVDDSDAERYLDYCSPGCEDIDSLLMLFAGNDDEDNEDDEEEE